MKKIILSEDQINQIIELYKSGLSYDRIQDKTGINANKVKRTLKEYNVQLRSFKNGEEIRRSFTHEEETEIIKAYNNGVGLTSIAKMFNCSPVPARNMLIKNGVKIRNKEEAHEYQKMGIDECYFDTIDNQDKAYILGLLFSDGTNCIRGKNKNEYYISICLKIDDMYILDKIRTKMGIERKIRVHKRKSDGREYARLEIKNKHMSLRLEELGVVQNKTFITQFPEYLREDLIPHFIRGLMDGDGCIAKSLKSILFAGSHEMMCGLVKQFEKYLGFTVHIVKIKHSPGISSVAVSRLENKAKLLHWLYDNADLKLERKYQLGIQIMDKANEKLMVS